MLAEPVVEPYLSFDLAAELEQLHGEESWTTGQTSKTLVKYDELRIVLTSMKAHKRIPLHHTDARVSIQTVAGHIQVRMPGATVSLPAGSLLTLKEGLLHDVEALEESAFLLTIAWTEEARSGALAPADRS